MGAGATGEPEVGEVLPQHKFDLKSLEAYLQQHLPGFGATPESRLLVAQYRSGQSNPTFYLQKGFQTYVLRKKPPGLLLPKAHKIDREFKVQKALYSVGFPVPKPLLYCSDASVIGTEFYVMEHVQGRIFHDFSIPGVSPAERSALYVAMTETLARLHSFSVQSLQLEGYGTAAGYCKRQVLTWTKQYQATAHQDIPAMVQLSEWLMKNVPDNDNEESLIHGDFKLDNIVFHPKEEVIEFYIQNENSMDKWRKPLVIDKLKEMAKAEDLWNLFLPAVSGLSQVDYALIAEETGRCFFAPDVFNCQAPDTGNMEVLHLYGNEEQKRQWLEPLLQGHITSAFCMTEPDVASSDATNIECSIHQDGDSYVVNGKKWWTSGEGRGFEISQGRLGPGRIHHCMRTVGLAERALQIMCERATQRVAFKKELYAHEVVAHWIAESRIAIEEIRLLTLKAAHSIDTLGSAGAKKEIAMIKVAAPRAVCKIIDRAIQVCGGAGVSQDYPLANMYALTRTLRIADGPDEVHLSAIAGMELREQAKGLSAKM
ncbi:Acyl-CoA dehydrogenase family member 11 [Tupaia chinensis]|uniref:Acyl-CoA dehydrogenase family member 11 n=1 Tax=Tupaia chinensis TaxID=246437 RepID=L8Y751_TUPCH|nr:Acyl-CoA dehydrogenase family member 11 [Tupaia chinensis]